MSKNTRKTKPPSTSEGSESENEPLCAISGVKATLSRSSSTDQKRVIINVDVGFDDFYALLVLLYAEQQGDLKIEAIVCSSGNTDLNNVLRNTVRLLELVQRTDIPIYKGIGQPIILPAIIIDYHGKDGLGDLKHDYEPNMHIIEQESAASAINNLINNNPKKISLICLGPLTDIAIASKLNSNFSFNVNDIWILGGNYEAVNQSQGTTEFNFFYDPEAAHIVFDLDTKIYIYTCEGFMSSRISFDWRYNNLGVSAKSPAIALGTRIEKSLAHEKKGKFWQPADALLTFCFVYPDKCEFRKHLSSVNIELRNPEKLGWILLDVGNKKRNVQLIDFIKEEAFMEFILEVEENL